MANLKSIIADELALLGCYTPEQIAEFLQEFNADQFSEDMINNTNVCLTRYTGAKCPLFMKKYDDIAVIDTLCDNCQFFIGPTGYPVLSCKRWNKSFHGFYHAIEHRYRGFKT
jgi:hypothetical protein